jgi:two-component system, response regulator PdtaR
MSAQRSTRAVLVVEDEALLRLDLAQTFEASGFEVSEAASAFEALAILDGHPEICAVFTDIDMPGTMDGLQLAHVIRERWPPTIVIVGSGHNHPAAEELPERATFVPKPYQEDDLAAVIHSLDAQIAPAGVNA